jgi:hypothetical protein
MHQLMTCKGVRLTNMSEHPTLGVEYMYMGCHPCLGKCVSSIEVPNIALGSVMVYWDPCTHI